MPKWHAAQPEKSKLNNHKKSKLDNNQNQSTAGNLALAESLVTQGICITCDAAVEALGGL
jgi:riboflavin synthase alpha subunit